MSVVISILIAVVIFGLIITVHEFGHYIAAKKNDVLVLEFAIGMGPILLKKQGKETLYTLRAFPLGGFCKMLGDMDDDSDKPRALSGKKVWQRLIISASGALLNFLLAFIVLVLIVAFTNSRSAEIWRVAEGSPAEAAGLLPDDRIIRANGFRVNVHEDLMLALNVFSPGEADLVVMRNGEQQNIVISPRHYPEENVWRIGVNLHVVNGMFASPIDGAVRTASLGETLQIAAGRGLNFANTTIMTVRMLVTGQLSINDLYSPIGVTALIGESVSELIDPGEEAASIPFGQRLAFLVNFAAILCALISVNVGVFNLLPFPALDGGRIVFLIIEGIRRKPVPVHIEAWVHSIGMILLLLLAGFVIFSDIFSLM